MKKTQLGILGITGGIIYAAAGAVMAAGNLGWRGGTPDSNALFPALGIGLALIVVALAVVHGRDIWRQGLAGRIAASAGVAAPVMFLVSQLIGFAILGTFAAFIAILAFTIAVRRGRLLPRLDFVLLCVASVASITWNTETPSAALLIVVGLVGSWVSYSALIAGRWHRANAV